MAFVESTEAQGGEEQSIVGTYEVHHVINIDNITGEQIFRFDIGDVKTNGVQYWLNTSFEITGSDSQGSISYKYEAIIYMDTDAGLVEGDIQIPSIEDCAKDSLYLYVDPEQAEADIAAGKGLTIHILGGGSFDNILSLAIWSDSILDSIDGETIYISNEKIEEYKEKYGDMLLIIGMRYSGTVPVYSNLQIEI